MDSDNKSYFFLLRGRMGELQESGDMPVRLAYTSLLEEHGVKTDPFRFQPDADYRQITEEIYDRLTDCCESAEKAGLTEEASAYADEATALYNAAAVEYDLILG